MASPPTRARNRWFHRLIRLFPLEFRSEFEPEMEAVFDEQRRAAPTPRLRWRLWVRTLIDTLRSAPREHLDVIRQDARFAVRVLRRSPAFTFAAIVTLALGIGANTAVFSLVRAVLLRPLPYEQPDRLVNVARGWLRPGAAQPRRGILTGTDVLAFRERATTIGDIAVVNIYSGELSSPVDLFLPDVAERLRGGLVTSNFFETLGVHAAMGRLFGSRDNDSEQLAVLSDGYWRSRFGSDPHVVGRTIDLKLVGRRETTPRRFTIVGVLPPRFRFTYPRETEIWAMLPWSAVKPTGAVEYEVVARLKPGATAGGAQAELTAIRSYPAANAVVVLATPLPELALAEARPGVLLLLTVAAVVLLIACINVILLLLGRMAERGSEVAIRTALGAGFVRIGRQLLMETGVLVGVGGTVGVALAFALQPVFRALVPDAVTRGDELTVDVPVLAFAVAICALLTVVCGLAPLWHVSARSLHDRLKQGAWQASANRGMAVWRRGVVTAQVAVVLVLLVSATLLLHSFWRLRHVDLGYDGRDVLTMEVVSHLPTTFRPGWLPGFQRELIERVRSLPGVTDASMTTSVPMRGTDFTYRLGAVGGPIVPAHMRSVDARYFDVMRIPVIAGRAFTDHDTADSRPVAIVSQAYARLLFGDRNPLGERVDLDETKPEIVGVVGDVRHDNVKDLAAPAFYLPTTQHPMWIMCLVVRTQRDVTATAADIRAAVHALAPAQPVERITTLDGIVADTTSGERFYAVTTGAFGGIALLLAIAGLIGVVRRGVSERTRELAVRTALGADPGALVSLILRQELRPVGVGAVLGLIGAFWLSSLLRRFLFEVSPLDPWAYALASALLVIAALVGAYFPARRVTRIDPATALRAE